MSRFLVLLRDDPSGFASLSPAEMQTIIEKYIAWGARLRPMAKRTLAAMPPPLRRLVARAVVVARVSGLDLTLRGTAER